MDTFSFKVIRQFRKLTQRELAERVGTSESTIRAIESGRRRVRPDELAKFAEALDCDPAHLSEDDDAE